LGSLQFYEHFLRKEKERATLILKIMEGMVYP